MVRHHSGNRRCLYRSSQLRHGADRPVTRSAGLSGRHHLAAGLDQRPGFPEAGPPNLFFGVTGGNMDSMVNRYTSDKKIRSNDAYTPDGEPANVRIAR